MIHEIIFFFLVGYTMCQNINISVCGDGIVDVFDEECDSTEHCTNCYCDNGYESVNSVCVPKCDIEGCIGGCISPNECTRCIEPEYQWDCHSCGNGYHIEGFMNCVPYNLSDVYGCYKMLTDTSLSTVKTIQLDSSLLSNTQEYTLYLKDFRLTVGHCNSAFNPRSPYVKGIWIELNVIDEGYYIIETEKEYSKTLIEYINAQQFRYGFDSVITVQNECFKTDKIGFATCLGKNNDLNDYILSASFLSYYQVRKYYLHVFGQYGLVPTTDLKLYVRKINHPCSERSVHLLWSDMISSTFTAVVNTVNSLTSLSSCSRQPQPGTWFFLKGADETIMVSACNNSVLYDTYIHLIQVPKINDDLSNVSCGEGDSTCVGYSDRGCGVAAKLMHKLDSSYDYFIFVSATEKTQLNVEFSTVCPYNCLNGVCSVSKGGCICNEGYIERNNGCTKCGNGVVDENEECDPSNKTVIEYYCSEETCMCSFGYVPVTINGITKCAISTCGNNKIDEYEECDGGRGCDHCHCIGDYYAYAKARKDCILPSCGNGRFDAGEECDGGKGCIECECQPGWYSKHSSDCRRYSTKLIALTIFLPGLGIYICFALVLLIINSIKYSLLIDRIKFELNQQNIIFSDAIIPFDSADCYKIPVLNEYFNIHPQSINFMNNKTDIDIGVVVESTCVITNFSNETMNFIFHGKKESKYDLVFTPCRGVLRKGQNKEIKIQLLMHCTTILSEEIKVTIGFSHFKKLMNNYQHQLSLNGTKLDKSNKSQRSFRSSFSSVSNQNSTSSDEVSVKPSKAKRFYVTLTLEAQSSLSYKLNINDITTYQPPIGEGTFGIVYKGHWRSLDVAVKIIKTDIVSIADLIQPFTEEVKLLEKLRSSCIVSFIGYCADEETVCLVLEFCPLGSLKKYLQSMPTSVHLKLRFCQDISRGMLYLHENNIIHRDLKTDNVLVLSDNPYDAVVCKVSDFGTSKCFIEQSNLKEKKDIGTPMYMAPEIHSEGILKLKSDVFSFAVCMLEIWLGKPPYSSDEFPNAESIFRFVCAGKRLHIPKKCLYHDMIKKCWKGTVDSRPSFKEIEEYFEELVQTVREHKDQT
ncbi:protein tyrosine kinase domain containing protein [Entamoeba histolytica HM-3:IMSS]|nr:protein tyrosine kinase domain containing protein [Entamoeba histolytica KU27]EMS13920.1 protein tyrosine kinase domain containing protein [Entamoeba histolytica HM-3:IMSS]GAT93221.1 protein tyrosine kinase domain-containing protein [Entamoeba histolytica]